MRLRQTLLALVALVGIWIGVLIQRSHPAAPPAPFAAGPQPADFSAQSVQLVRVKGLKRPVAATPVPRAEPKIQVVTPTPARVTQVKAPKVKRQDETPEPSSSTVLLPQDERTVAESPPPPLEPLEIADAQVVALTSSSARVTWRTNVPTQSQAAFGLDTPTVWSQPSGQSLIQHEAVLSGLDFSTNYQIYLHAVDEWNRTQRATLSLSTGPMPASSSARTNGDDIVVDDRPVFPTAVWAQCTDGIGSNVEDGINLFMGDGCRDDSHLPEWLDGRAYSIVDAENVDLQGRGLVGWYYPDEWDAFLPGDLQREDINEEIIAPRAGRISFLTLTNHFYSRAEALPEGKEMYPVLFSIPDVIGFDLYPLQVWCRPTFRDVFDAQAELHTASGGKPTFQWIEVAPMEHPCKKHRALDPTPATVRAETWLAIGGGADAIGYFPNRWPDAIGDEITRTNREIKALAPALLAPHANASSDASAVRVSARSLNGALYVIAVNTADTSIQAKISVEGIGGRSATVLGGGAVGADDQGFSDTFGPLQARVYIIPPAGW
jgi:hypothetical protein